MHVARTYRRYCPCATQDDQTSTGSRSREVFHDHVDRTGNTTSRPTGSAESSSPGQTSLSALVNEAADQPHRSWWGFGAARASDTLTIHPSHRSDDYIGRVSVVIELDLKIQRRIKIHHFLRLPVRHDRTNVSHRVNSRVDLGSLDQHRRRGPLQLSLSRSPLCLRRIGCACAALIDSTNATGSTPASIAARSRRNFASASASRLFTASRVPSNPAGSPCDATRAATVRSTLRGANNSASQRAMRTSPNTGVQPCGARRPFTAVNKTDGFACPSRP